MKVLQVLPELNSGGVERGTVELARFLVEKGHQSLVVSHGGRLASELSQDGSRHIALPVHKKSLLSLRLVPQLVKLLEDEQPDILHLRSRVPAWLFYLAWKKLSPKSRPRLVTTVHGFYSVNFYSAIMTKGERVICVSQSVQEYVLENYPRTSCEKLTVIHRGVDTADYSPHYQPSLDWQEKWREQFPQFKGKILLLLPGRITRWKGHEDFLTLLAHLRTRHPGLHGVIAGGPSPGKEGYLAELEVKSQALELADSLTFLGHRSDLREVIAACDFTLSLSLDPEAFGRVSLEALSLGKPVAAYAHGGVAEQLDALFPIGKVPPAEPLQAANLIEEWLQTPPAPPLSNEKFTLASMCQQTVAVYEELLSSRSLGDRSHSSKKSR
jgi:glycosyltransferase involved in cell wall biosynthesis